MGKHIIFILFFISSACSAGISSKRNLSLYSSYAVDTEHLSLRTSPKVTSYNLVGYLGYGDTVKVVDVRSGRNDFVAIKVLNTNRNLNYDKNRTYYVSYRYLNYLSVTQNSSTPRPPQFVMLAFDGSKSNAMWQDTLDFARDARRKGIDMNFTYFISAVYFLKKSERYHYDPPKGEGKSAIGFANNNSNIVERVRFLNRAHDQNHEVASHACGHFDGSSWSYYNWINEFYSFNDLVFNYDLNNDIQYPDYVKLNFSANDVVGFRAPLLGVSNGLWPTLKYFNYRYDTSQTNVPSYWPKIFRKSNAWNFPLANLTIAGTAKKTLSMDYNFYVFQTGAKPITDRDDLNYYQKQMEDTYLNYFLENYNGNRAPIHIGHHFSKWNNGIYWEAMKKFAMKVCGLPEVRCVTYTELADYMDNLNKREKRDFQIGRFVKMERKFRFKDNTPIKRPFLFNFDFFSSNAGNGENLIASVRGPDADKLPEHYLQWEINGKPVINSGTRRSVNIAGKLPFRNNMVSIVMIDRKNGMEIARTTKVVSPKRTFKVGGPINSRLEVSRESIEERLLKGEHRSAHMENREGYDIYLNVFKEMVREKELLSL